MKIHNQLLFSLIVLAQSFTACSQTNKTKDETSNTAAGEKVVKSESQWKKELSPDQFYVMREQGTEKPFTGKLYDNHKSGTYVCSACELPLFDSNTKFDSGTGWPSFYDTKDKKAVEEEKDNSLGMTRSEVHCSRCGGHLGHVFEDGPKPTGLRYCINSVSLNFVPAK